MHVAMEKARHITVRKHVLFSICLEIVSLIPMIYFYLSAQWLLVTALPVILGLLLYARWSSKPILMHISLAGSTTIYAIGILSGIPLLVMLVAMAAALACWDFVLERQLEYSATEKYERQHLQFLGIALGFGVLGAGSLHWLNLRLPFGVMLALGLIMLVSINQFISYLRKSKSIHR